MKRFLRWVLLILGFLLVAILAGLLVLRLSPAARDRALVYISTAASAPYVRQIDDATRDTLLAYLNEHGLPPDDYVLKQFDTHDIVFLGEFHRIRHDPLFVQSLIPQIYEAGVRNLGFEFARASDQACIDSLLGLDTYDRALAKRLLWNNMNGWWPYEEYLGLFRAAWRLNASLPADARRFRILGLTPLVDYEALYHGTEEEQRAERRRSIALWDTTMAAALAEHVLARGEKALVYCGIHHAFTGYRQPVLNKKQFVRFSEPRAGNYIEEWYPGSAVTIYLHAPWGDYDNQLLYYLPFRGFIDQTFRAYGRPVGFDLRGTPFGELPAPGTIYEPGYPDFKADLLYDGYIILNDLADYEGVTVIRDWVGGAEEIRRLARGAPAGSPGAQIRTADDFYRVARHGARVHRRFAGVLRLLDRVCPRQ